MELGLWGRGLWKLASSKDESETGEQVYDETEAKVTKHEYALAYILTSVENSCKAILRQPRCHHKARKTFKESSHTVSPVPICAKLSILNEITRKKDEHTVK